MIGGCMRRRGEKPWYDKIRGTHYFQGLPVQERIAGLARDLMGRHGRERVWVITSVSLPEEVYYEHVSDKIRAIQAALPELMPSHFFVTRGRTPQDCPLTKSQTAEKALGRRLTPKDVLYDDFNPNLEEWQEAGGTPIKVLNGINTYRSDMRSIRA